MTDSDKEVFSIHIDGTMKDVWHELTRTDRPQAFLWHAVLHTPALAPGNPYQMRAPDGRNVNAVGDILECEPPRLLKQTLRFTQLDDPPCTVTYKLEEAPQGGVAFTMTVEGLPADSKTIKGFKGSGGGSFVCATLKRVVETGKPSLSTRAMYKVFDVLGSLVVPKRCRVENWPMENTSEST